MTIEVVRMGPPWAEPVAALWTREFGSTRVASNGLLHELLALPTLVALHDDVFAGAVAYRFDGGGGCEVVGLASAVPAVGAGTALLEAVTAEARAVGCRRAWLVTTNDNLGALRFYQLRGWRLAVLRVEEVTRARATLKPEIPARGVDAIPIRDEIELELPLG
ncbi:MAG: GNAT family N-acetyltransferase [Dehalococcoidia bacterium]|nr:GNAT family N-acetyltransferase [Dehalococcoidia bacterium]